MRELRAKRLISRRCPLGLTPTLASEHGFRLGVFEKQPAIDQRRQILAPFGGDLKTVLDRIGRCRHARVALNWSSQVSASVPKTASRKKKEQGELPCSKNCVDPISRESWI